MYQPGQRTSLHVDVPDVALQHARRPRNLRGIKAVLARK